MKVYFTLGKYYEVKAEAHRAAREGGTTFTTLDLPFGASPKGDFIAWLNERSPVGLAEAKSGMTVEQAMEPNALLDDVKWKPVAPPKMEQSTSQFSDQLLAFEDEWENFPLARKLHFAALACEDARQEIKP